MKKYILAIVVGLAITPSIIFAQGASANRASLLKDYYNIEVGLLACGSSDTACMSNLLDRKTDVRIALKEIDPTFKTAYLNPGSGIFEVTSQNGSTVRYIYDDSIGNLVSETVSGSDGVAPTISGTNGASPEARALVSEILKIDAELVVLNTKLKQMADAGQNLATTEARNLVEDIRNLEEQRARDNARLQVIAGPVSNTSPVVNNTNVGNGNAPVDTKEVGTGNAPFTAKLENPLGGNVDSLGALFVKLFDIIVGISYAVVAFFLILSGFKFVTAQGNPTELEKAKTTFWYTIIGALLVIGAQTIATILQSLITEVGK